MPATFPRPLRSPAASLRPVLVHQLDKVVEGWREEVAAGLLREPDDPFGKMESMVQAFDEGFLEDYDPCVFVQELATLKSLDGSVRRRLLDALRNAYEAGFRPFERRTELRVRAAEFQEALSAWRGRVLEFGVTSESERLWKRLVGAAKALRDWLEDPALATRWIP